MAKRNPVQEHLSHARANISLEENMTLILDPEGNETSALFEIFSDWTGKSVLEIGSGDGRLTWRYADKVARVVGLEPDGDKYKAGLDNHPSGFEHVEFLNLGLDEFVQQNKEKFDLALLSWSL
jgi:cyclopropane fatty-acyl-phospholipid synthase-like methyltransferase